uniref:CSON015402 protein n=1 Tax=Culicoides sonorensis TaxID=179676 RepID=A0A336KWG6_CULSO
MYLVVIIHVIYSTGDCDTNQILKVRNSNLKFLNILRTKKVYQVRKSDRSIRNGKNVYFYCSNYTIIYPPGSRSTCKGTSCPEPVYDASTTEITCDGYDCAGRQITNTELEITCRTGFVPDKRTSDKITCLQSGFWDSPLYSCTTKKEKPHETGFIFNGKTARELDAPWHVAIYEDKNGYEAICGGSLIGPRLVGTARHCFKNAKPKFDKKKYKAVIGSLTRDYDLNEGTHFSIINYLRDDERRDLAVANDFAIAVLDRPVDEKYGVFLLLPEKPNVFLRRRGQLAGFGLTENQKTAPRLLITNLTIEVCKKLRDPQCLPSKKNLCDKHPGRAVFCSKDTNSNSAACIGDSGGGLVVKDANQLYLSGVVSGTYNSESCEYRENVIFSDAGAYNDLYRDAQRYLNSLKQSLPRKSCPASDFPCKNSKCIPFEKVCDGSSDCDDDESSDQCKFRATHHMLITGLSILKFIGNQAELIDDKFPNWAVSSAALWNIFNFYHIATDPVITLNLERDFGVVTDSSVNNLFRQKILNEHIKSSISYTGEEALPQNVKRYFKSIISKRRFDDWFYSATDDRISNYFHFEYNINFPYEAQEIATSYGSTDMICTNLNYKLFKWEKFAYVVDVKLFNKTHLMMIMPGIDEPLDNVIDALKVWSLKDLQKFLSPDSNYDGVCFPRFKVHIEMDHSPILFKMGYDYLFTPERLNLVKLGIDDVRIETTIKTFVKIWDAENDYDDPTFPYPNDVEDHFKVENPFIFILYDFQTNIPWTVGKINNPNLRNVFVNSEAENYPIFP